MLTADDGDGSVISTSVAEAQFVYGCPDQVIACVQASHGAKLTTSDDNGGAEAGCLQPCSLTRGATSLQAMHGRAALTTFDDSGGAEVDIEVLTQDITRLFRKCEGRLQHFGAGVPSSEADEKAQCLHLLHCRPHYIRLMHLLNLHLPHACCHAVPHKLLRSLKPHAK